MRGEGASSEFYSESRTHLWFSAGGGAGVWSVFRILFVIDDHLVVSGGRRSWRVKHSRNSCRSRRPSRGFQPLAAVARGVSSEFCSESTTRSRFCAGGGAGAWSVLKILSVINDLQDNLTGGGASVGSAFRILSVIEHPLVVLGGGRTGTLSVCLS